MQTEEDKMIFKIKKMDILEKKQFKEILSLMQIILLIFGMIAISYSIGSSFGIVSAQQSPAQCAKISSSYWKVIGDNVRCVPGHCSPKSYETIGEKSIDWFCETHLDGGPYQNEFCTSTGGGSRLTWSIITEKLVDCPAEEALVQNPSTTGGSPTEGGTLDELIKGALAASGYKATSEAIDIIKEAIGENISLESIKEAIKSNVDKLTRENWIARATKKVYNFYKPEGNSFSQHLKHSATTSGSMGAIAFLITAIGTGDLDKAWRVGLRVFIGAEIGYLAGLGLSAGLTSIGLATGPVGWLIVGGQLLGAMFSKFLSREQDRMLIFQCMPWKAETGGNNCGECNNKEFPCTEYQCRSLGAGCELVNKDTDEPRCVQKDPRDLSEPRITPWTEVLTTGYRYDPLPRGQYGVELKYRNEECLPAFTPFAIGIELDKEGYCKIEYSRTSNFSEMKYNFGGTNNYLTQHAHIMSFPGAANIKDHLERLGLNEEAISEILSDGKLEFYVRCESVNGKSNREEFLFEFCIDKKDDGTAPVIRGFNWRDNTPISYFKENEAREVNLQVYTNEPAQCKWAHEDKSYEDMENSLSCQDNLISFNAQLSYTCSGKLTGLENLAQNKFYFRCNDTSGNVNSQSKTLTLIGTQPLIIDEVSPDGLIKGATDLIKVTFKVKTSAGEREGQSECSYRSSETSGQYVKFSSTNSHTHSTNIWLEPRAYTYDIRCIDLGGNSDTATVSFSVETDTSAPVVVRAFKQENQLKIITNEEASCVYDTVDCSYNFEDGNSISSSDNKKEHSIPWDSQKTFYIKCQDDFGNRPLPNQCSIIARPFQN